MLLKGGKPNGLLENEVTDEKVYQDRRKFLAMAGFAAAGFGAAGKAVAMPAFLERLLGRGGGGGGDGGPPKDDPTSYGDVTTYNNFYEFGLGKGDPAKHAGKMVTRPWHVEVAGEVAHPGVYAVDDLVPPTDVEERIYRMRCVEGWSMVIPWNGVPLGDIIRRLEPNSKAKFVAFETLHDPRQMPGQKSSVLDWPYVEGLRMDEAMHPLTLIATGLYGKTLPNQNGAPLRLVVPWKYGFKSIKSIVRMHFMENRPKTSWELAGPREYGFYANVNPEVDHPRWSQKMEHRIGEFGRRPTLMFNGYGEEVAHLYAGMDLRRDF